MRRYLICSFFAVFILSSSVHVFAQPKITAVTPQKGPWGGYVLITGKNFGTNPIVHIGAKRPEQYVSYGTDTSFTLSRFPGMITNTPIHITANGLTGYWSSPFGTTFQGGGVIDSNSFQRNDVPLTQSPFQFVMADFNGDGYPDLIESSGTPGAMIISLFGRAGTQYRYAFYPRTGTTIGSGMFLAVGDFNGDGLDDIATTSNDNSSVSILMNNAGQGFAAPINFPLNAIPSNLTTADVDGDGKPDIIVTTSTGVLGVYPNQSSSGTVSFGTRKDYSVGRNAGGTVVTDLNGDGKPDVGVANQTDNTISIFQNASSPGNIQLTSKGTIPAGTGPVALGSADIDGDGKQDLVASNGTGNTVSIFKNLSSAGNLSFASKTDFPVGISGNSMSIADFDGDGMPDVAVASATDNSIAVIKNTTFNYITAFAPQVRYPTSKSPQNIQAIDMDSSGKYSMVVLNGDSNSLSSFGYKASANPPPSIVYFSPDTAAKGDTVTITGINFSGTSAVSFGATPAASFTVLSAATIQAVVGAGTSGGVSVRTANGLNTLPGFVYRQTIVQPVIRQFSPTSDTTGGTVSIVGQHFTGVSSVFFGGTSAASFKVVDDTLIQAVVGQGSTGNVVVSNPAGIDSLAKFTYVSPAAPIISSFTPTSSKSNATITIRGQHLARTTSVSFGGIQAFSFKIISDSVITAAVSTGATGAVMLRTAQDSVAKPGFTYLGASPKVIFDSLSPAQGYPEAVTLIIGKNLTYVTDIDMYSMGNNISYTILSDSTIRLQFGIPGLPGNYYGYIVSGPDSIPFHFKFLQIPALPFLKSFSPQSDTTAGTVTIRGKNFTYSTGVSFGTTPAASFTIVSDSVITAKVGNGSSGYVGVQFGDVLDSLPGFTFVLKSDTNKSQPQIRYFSPQTAGSGDMVNIVGTKFTGVNAITFGSVNASSFHINSDTSITAIVGNGASGWVAVRSASGADSLSGFTFTQKTDSTNRRPQIRYFDPQTAGTNETVTIFGSGFSDIKVVQFGDSSARSFVVQSDSIITAIVGNGASGYVKVSSAIAADSLATFIYKTAADTIEDYKLVQFAASSLGANVLLAWTAQNEKAIVSYTVEQSTDSAHFSDIGIKQSLGTGGPNNYVFNDSTAAAPIKYYRLRISDDAGAVSYSQVISVVSAIPNGVYPNPASGFITVIYPSSISESEIFIVDISGRVVITVTEPPATTQATINIARLRPGIYKIKWADWRSSFTKTVLVK